MDGLLRFVRGKEQAAINNNVAVSRPGYDGAQFVADRSQSDRMQRDFHRNVAAHKAAGYALAIDGLAVESPFAIRYTPFVELELAIDAAPDDEATWLVLADAWTSAGDPRGDCVMFDRALRDVSDSNVYVANKREAEIAHRVRNASVFGSLGDDDYRLRASFRRGLVDRVTVADERLAPGRSTRDLLRAILADPFARFTRELVVRDLATPEIFDAVCDQSHPHLRSILLEGDLGVAAPRLEAAFPRLERLAVDTPVLDWTGVGLPQLAILEITTFMTPREAAALLAWVESHPRLREVALRTNGSQADTRAPLAEVVEPWLADRDRWPPTLQRLVLNGHDCGTPRKRR